MSERIHRFARAGDNLDSVAVYPSMVDLHWKDGTVVTIDVGMLYAMFAAHLRQNGIWAQPQWNEKFEKWYERDGPLFSFGAGGGLWRTPAHYTLIAEAVE